VARAVAKAAVADAVAPALTDDQIDQAIDRTRWLPRYQALSTSVLVDLRTWTSWRSAGPTWPCC